MIDNYLCLGLALALIFLVASLAVRTAILKIANTPRSALQRALMLPPALLREPPSRTSAALLHQGGYPARLMRLLDADTVREVLADIPVAEPETGRLFQLYEFFDAALEKYELAEAIARVRTRVYLSLARRSRPDFQEEDLGTVVRDAVTSSQAELAAHEIRTDLSIEPGLPSVCLDETQMRQVLLNLIRNAREAMVGHDARRAPHQAGDGRGAARGAAEMVDVHDIRPAERAVQIRCQRAGGMTARRSRCTRPSMFVSEPSRSR